MLRMLSLLALLWAPLAAAEPVWLHLEAGWLLQCATAEGAATVAAMPDGPEFSLSGAPGCRAIHHRRGPQVKITIYVRPVEGMAVVEDGRERWVVSHLWVPAFRGHGDGYTIVKEGLYRDAGLGDVAA